MVITFAEEFKTQCISRMAENTPRVYKCLNLLTEEEVWARPNDVSNSIGNIILHLCGNIRQYIISSLGNKPDIRERDREFTARNAMTKAELLEQLHETVTEATDIIAQANEQDLLRVRSVQGFQLSGIGIIVHVAEHYSYHTGQIAFWTKLLKASDLGFYAGTDLNIKNA